MKRITALMLALLMTASMAACSAQVDNGGKPIPGTATQSAYEADPDEIVFYEIDQKNAKTLLAELDPIIDKMGDKVLESDMVYFKKVVNFLKQFNSYESEWAQYMHAVEELCDGYYDMYVLNCTATETKAKIDEYYNTYYNLSDEFKGAVSAYDAADLYAIMTQIDIMVNEMFNSSEPESAPTSSTVSTETPS